jgi:hypothetical protein
MTPSGILYITPSSNTSPHPVIDQLTRKMTAALRKGQAGRRTTFHVCACGAHSDNTDYTLPNRRKTNSLAVHYLAFHRSEIPNAELAKVMALQLGEEEPTTLELASPWQML